eukprot:scaffold667584_cov46-Prasinocladus_malaysianus.AAC.1
MTLLKVPNIESTTGAAEIQPEGHVQPAGIPQGDAATDIARPGPYPPAHGRPWHPVEHCFGQTRQGELPRLLLRHIFKPSNHELVHK